MSTWTEVDAWARTQPAKPGGEWRAFAKLASGALRFRARQGDTRIKVERPCGFRPGAWRSEGYRDRNALPGLRALTPDQASAVLVALDQWLEGGAQRMNRPTVIP